jgi:hypothetical protein
MPEGADHRPMLRISAVGRCFHVGWCASEELDYGEVYDQQQGEHEDRERSGIAPGQEHQDRDGHPGDAQRDLVRGDPGADGSGLPTRLVGSPDASDEPAGALTRVEAGATLPSTACRIGKDDA